MSLEQQVIVLIVCLNNVCEHVINVGKGKVQTLINGVHLVPEG